MAETRAWRVHTNPETGEVDLGALDETLAEVGTALRRFGGSVGLLAHRQRVDHGGGLPNEFVTVAVDVQWFSRTDTRPRAETPPPPEPEVVDSTPVADGEFMTVAESEVDNSAIPASMR